MVSVLLRLIFCPNSETRMLITRSRFQCRHDPRPSVGLALQALPPLIEQARHRAPLGYKHRLYPHRPS